MPPRLSVFSSLYKLTAQRVSIASFLVPFLQRHPQKRSASILASLSDVPSAYNKRIRRGRGPSSGKGKTSGRGHKGQKQHGKVPRGFNGGQTPDEVVHGKRGFKNVFALRLARVNVDRLQEWIDQGRLDITKPITVKELHESRCTHGIKDGVKLLARNAAQLRSPIHITVSRASAAAIAAIEAAGGSVQTRYYTYTSIQRIFKGLTHPTQSLLSPPKTGEEIATGSAAVAAHVKPPSEYRYRLPDPASRKDIEYYRDPAHRGYLSYLVAEGESPSLFFKTPFQDAKSTNKKVKDKKAPGAKREENRLW